MKEILKLAFSLTLICAVAGAALAYVSSSTAKPREEARLRQRNEKMALLLPLETVSTDEFKTEVLDDGTKVVFFAAKDASGSPLAYCAEGSDPSGFGGEVKLLVGINLDGTIRGVLVSENSETPGIGSRVCERSVTKSIWSAFKRKSADDAISALLPPNSYLDCYTGQTFPADGFEFNAMKAPGKVTPISGATVSSTAVLNAVNRISKVWNETFTTNASK